MGFGKYMAIQKIFQESVDSCPPSKRFNYRKFLRHYIRDFLIENPDATVEDLREAIGEPASILQGFLSDPDDTTVCKELVRMNRVWIWIVVALILIVVIAVVAALLLLDMNSVKAVRLFYETTA